MSTILLIFQIAKILLNVAPELYTAFMEIMAAVKHTEPMGNEAADQVVKSTARAIMPVLDAGTAAQVQRALDDYEAGALAYKSQYVDQQ